MNLDELNNEQDDEFSKIVGDLQTLYILEVLDALLNLQAYDIYTAQRRLAIMLEIPIQDIENYLEVAKLSGLVKRSPLKYNYYLTAKAKGKHRELRLLETIYTPSRKKRLC